MVVRGGGPLGGKEVAQCGGSRVYVAEGSEAARPHRGEGSRVLSFRVSSGLEGFKPRAVAQSEVWNDVLGSLRRVTAEAREWAERQVVARPRQELWGRSQEGKGAGR